MTAPITTAAALLCGHSGTISPSGNPRFTIGGLPVAVAGDVSGQVVSGCTTPPSSGPPPTSPCGTVSTESGGQANRLRVGGKAVLMDSVGGSTDGNPTGTVSVSNPGQVRVTTL